jgi:hypothetical protein
MRIDAVNRQEIMNYFAKNFSNKVATGAAQNITGNPSVSYR